MAFSIVDAINDLASLYGEAKDKNEYEFIMTLLNYKSIGSVQAQANLHEWFEALGSYSSYYSSFSGKQKTRMAALLYSTFFENSDFYNIIGSLCKIKLGFRSSSYLFWKTKKYERFLGIGEKEDFLRDLLTDAGKLNIISFFEENHYTEIRNTFFHSAYSLEDNDYILHDSGFIKINGIGMQSFDVEQFFYPMVDRVISFFEAFRKLYLGHFNSYQEDRRIGANPLGAEGIIIGTPRGLGGIRIPNAVQIYGEWHDSGIWYDEEFGLWGARNLNINFPAIEQIEISEQLTHYEGKDKVLKNDAAFNNLIDKVAERKNSQELTRAIKVLLKFGDFKLKEMEAEVNEFKKRSLPIGIIPFYRRAAEIMEGVYDNKPILEKVRNLESISGAT